MIAIAAITVSIVATAAPSATAHQVDGSPYAGTYPHQTEDWFSAWLDLMQEVGGLTPELIALRAELYEQDARAAATPGRALLAPDDIANSILGDIDRWPGVALFL